MEDYIKKSMNKQCGLCLLKTDMQEVVNKFDTLNRKQCDIILVGKVNTSFAAPSGYIIYFIYLYRDGDPVLARETGSVAPYLKRREFFKLHLFGL